MKKISMILAVICMMCMTTTVKAQMGMQMDPAAIVKSMDEGIAKNVTGLTDAQKTKIHELNTNYMNDMTKNRPQMNQGEMPSQDQMQAMMAQFQKSRDAYVKSLKEVFSEAQFAEYDKYDKAQRERMGMGGGGPQQ